jgi:hypothetical protein
MKAVVINMVIHKIYTIFVEMCKTVKNTVISTNNSLCITRINILIFVDNVYKSVDMLETKEFHCG